MNTCGFPLIVLLATVPLLGCGSTDGTKEAYLSKGDALLKSKNYQAATIEYRNALRIDPRFGAARSRLAESLEAAGDGQSAALEYVRAADLLPSDPAVQVAAAKALLRSGKWDDARARAEKALKLDPRNADAHVIRGRAAAGVDSFDEALQAFEEGLAASPERSDLYVNLGQLRTIQGNAAEAEASFKQAVAVAPDSPDARLSLADFYWYSGRLSEAEQALIEAVGVDKGGTRANRMLAMFYLSTKRLKEAEEPLKRAADSTANPQLRLILADYYTATGQYEAAIPLLDELAKLPEGKAVSAIRRAQLEFARKRKVEAYRIIDDLIRQNRTDANALLAKGDFLVADGQYESALAPVEAAVKADPRFARAQESLGIIQIRRNRWDEAGQALGEALRLNPRSIRAQIALVDVSLALGKPAEAVQYAEGALRVQSSSIEARYALARALLASGNVSRARTEAATLPSQQVRVQSLRGQIELRGGQIGAARTAFEAAATLNPSSAEALAGLVAVDTAEKKTQRAIDRVERYMSTTEPSAGVLYLAARTYAAGGKISDAETTARKALSLDPSLRQVYDLLGGLYRQQNKLGEAQKMYERLSADRPNDVPAHTMVGTLLLLQGNMAEARERFETVLTIDPRAAIASNNLAYMDAESGTNLDVALNRAQTAKAALPDDPEVNDTLGWVYVKRGLPALAFAPLEQAVQKEPKNPVYLYHLGVAYQNAGDNDRARASLEKALQLSKSFDGAADAQRVLSGLGR